MASIKLKGDTSGEVTISAPAVAGTTTLELPATSSTLATQNSLGVRNLIINGDMRIDQRNAGASVTPTSNGTYTLDRWRAGLDQSSKFSVQQSTTTPEGFINSLLVTSLSAYSVASGESFTISHNIEGLNCSHLNWGTSDAKTVTLSFWIRSSLTGTFGGSIANSSVNRSYPFSYTISSADTWEKKTVTITGDTTGTWLTTNGIGMRIWFSLGVGSSVSGTAGSWAGADYRSATGATSVVGTSGATLYITGVQLEVGTEATPFEHRPYDMELARCQRYFQKSYNVDVAPATATTVGVVAWLTQFTFSYHRPDTVQLKTTMRASPTIVLYNASTGATASIRNGTDSTNVSGATFREGINSFALYVNNSSIASEKELWAHYSASAEL